MAERFKVEWIDRGHPPKNPSDPRYPDGIDLDTGERPACHVALPYMVHENVGYWLVTCSRCKLSMLLTMASRPDDPRSVMMHCKEETDADDA